MKKWVDRLTEDQRAKFAELGEHISLVTLAKFCEDEGLTDALAQAADSACDAVWPMPMGGTYADQLKSVAADLANIGSPNNAGASTAASFLASFAPKGAWAHLDVAGTASVSGAKRASTARPVPLLTEFLLDRERAHKTRG
jgi:leucyl aminopeptidase